MKVAKIPEDENLRLQTLEKYQVLDTLPEQDFDDITKIASHICGTPVALISLVDENRQWFKSKVGIDAPETPRDVAFCAHAILEEDVFVIPDSLKDDRFHDNPLAIEAPHVRFYAGAPLKSPKGQNIGTLCVIDSTPRQLSEQQIEVLEALARQVIGQLELRLSIRKNEQNTQAKARFLANMSHEIRTPMNAVLSCTNLLLDNVKLPENVKLLKTVLNSGDTLLTLINDILDFSKIESEKIDLENEVFDLRENTLEIIEFLKVKAAEKKCALNCQFDENVPRWARGDVTRFRQILVNIVGNAIKFTKSHVQVNVSSSKIQDDRYEIKLSITDDGIGIPEEAKSKLFQDFSQVDASTTRKFGGTGLGLAISKGLAEAMGGRIWAESELEKGSVFSFTIVTEEVLEGTHKKKTKLSEINPNMAAEHPLKILLAEDNVVNQMVAKKIIAKLGYRIDVVANGLEAVEAVENNDYDIILMDQHMPEMDGVEATKKIRKTSKTKPKIFALTASVFKEDKNRCLGAGMDGFLEKPINVEEVVEAFNSCEANKDLIAQNERGHLIDLDSLYEQFEGSEDILREIAEQCLACLPQHMSDLEEALAKEDHKALEVASHTIKGTLANFKTDAIVETALKLEIMGRKKNLDEAEKIFQLLKKQISQLEPHLKKMSVETSS